MAKLLPQDTDDTLYVFHYSDTQDKGVLLRAYAGTGHGARPRV